MLYEKTPKGGSSGGFLCPDLCPAGNGEGSYLQTLDMLGVPTGIRTPVAGVKGQCPRPLDDGDTDLRIAIHILLLMKMSSRNEKYPDLIFLLKDNGFPQDGIPCPEGERCHFGVRIF